MRRVRPGWPAAPAPAVPLAVTIPSDLGAAGPTAMPIGAERSPQELCAVNWNTVDCETATVIEDDADSPIPTGERLTVSASATLQERVTLPAEVSEIADAENALIEGGGQSAICGNTASRYTGSLVPEAKEKNPASTFPDWTLTSRCAPSGTFTPPKTSVRALCFAI